MSGKTIRDQLMKSSLRYIAWLLGLAMEEGRTLLASSVGLVAMESQFILPELKALITPSVQKKLLTSTKSCFFSWKRGMSILSNNFYAGC